VTALEPALNILGKRGGTTKIITGVMDELMERRAARAA
jgi:hypothetical protein